MLVAAGALFCLAMLLLFVDRWFDLAEIDLSWPVRVLIFLSVVLIGLSYR